MAFLLPLFNLLVLCFMSLFVNALFPLLLLLHADPRTALSIAPNRLRYPHIIVIISLLIAKPWLRSVGFVPRLQVSAQLARKDSNTGEEMPGTFNLPQLMVTMPLSLDRLDRLRYQEALRSLDGGMQEHVTKSAMFLLAGVTTPLMSLLLAKRTSPILPLGAVNVRNRFEFLHPERCTEAVLGNLAISQLSGYLAPEGRRVKRGVEIDIVVEITTKGRNKTQHQVIFRQIITVLQFLKSNVEPRYVDSQQNTSLIQMKEDRMSSNTTKIKLSIEHNAPARWASVCKDYNPIHVSSWAARLFGFKGKVAHGNLVVARAMERLSVDDGVFQQMMLSDDKPWWLEVQFKRPVVVPMDLELQSTQFDSLQSIAATFHLVFESRTFVEGSTGWL